MISSKIRRYAIYFINFALFIALVIYSQRYGSVLFENLKTTNLNLIIIAFIFQFIILYLAPLKWNALLRKFNKTVKIKRTFLVYNASGIYKYIPPKGINYLMRLSFLKKEKLKGKITSIFGEFYTEIFIGALSSVILVLLYISLDVKFTVLVYLIMLLLIIGTVKPKLVLIIPNLLRLKLNKLRKLINNFSSLTYSLHYIYALIITFITAFLHGTTFYLINQSFGFTNLDLFRAIIIFYSAYFLSLLSFAPAGIGTRDISIVGLLMLIGYGPADAATVSLMSRVIIFIPEVIVGLISLYFVKKK